jgi:ATP-dependent Clp protease ATP-binding subunit ClpB
VTLEVSQAAKEFIAKAGYDAVYGARPLKRAFQKHVQDPLALKILSGEFVPGDHITIDAGTGGVKLSAPARA